MIPAWEAYSSNLERGNHLKFLIYFFSSLGVGWDWSPLGTSATNRSIVAAPDDRWWVWRQWWNENWQGKPKYSEKSYPSATLSTTNLNDLTWARSRAAAVWRRSWRRKSRDRNSGVSRVWQAGHVPWAPLAGGAIWLGALVPMPNRVNKKIVLTHWN
jgi:hypothetical protein